MVSFVKLTSVYDGNPVYVNPANITTIEPYSDGCTVINMTGNAYTKVKESAETVIESIFGCDYVLTMCEEGAE